MGCLKTKTMVFSKKQSTYSTNIYINGKKIKQVHTFTYLIDVLIDHGRAENEEERRRIEAKITFRSNYVKNNKPRPSITTKLRLTKFYACSTFWVGVKRWIKKISAFEIWVGLYRRIPDHPTHTHTHTKPKKN